MFGDARLLRRSDPDFPTTRAAQQRLVAAGLVAEERPLIAKPPTSVRSIAPVPRSHGWMRFPSALLAELPTAMQSQG